jgi:transposase-like protein
MDPQTQFCHNPACPARSQVGQGNIRVHSRKEHRYRCTTCGHTFAATTGTPAYRLHHDQDLWAAVISLLANGCPLQAVVITFGLDERTVAAWQARAGQHAQAVHEHVVARRQVELGHVQADEMWVKLVGGRVWQAMAMAVPSRLWLGGVISSRRDKALLRGLLLLVLTAAASLSVLIGVDGLRSYVTVVQQVWRVPLRTGRPGRPRRVAPLGLLLGQVVKQYVGKRVVGVQQRVVIGSAAAIRAVLAVTGTGSGINTAYIERLNATFRGKLAPLARRGRAALHRVEQLNAAMWLVGGLYNFCWEHAALRQGAVVDGRLREQGRTPAQAAGLTDHRWAVKEFLLYQVPPLPWVPPKRRGRPPKQQAAGVVA